MNHLVDEWLATTRRVGARDDVASAGARLIAAYAAPDRHYHGLAHLDEVLRHVDDLAATMLPQSEADAVRLAAWFHDAVYDARADDNEERSAALAERTLRSLRVPELTIAEVARLVRITRTHEVADSDANAAVLCDADLAVLARDPAGYREYTDAVRREYAQVDDSAFARGRARILRGLLEKPRLFDTPYARAHWEQPARANIELELSSLDP